MKASSVYRKAAERCHRMRYSWPSCMALSDELACSDFSHPIIKNYAKLFSPRKQINGYWPWGMEWGHRQEKSNCRILALLLMSAIAESEGD